jgi:type IV secretion system protein VirD4
MPAMGLLAGYGVQLWPILQDLSQLQDLYPHRWRSFLANAGVVQAFGVNDAGTAEYLSSLLGTRTVIVRHEGRSMDGKQRGTENYGPASRPLLMPHETPGQALPCWLLKKPRRSKRLAKRRTRLHRGGKA